MRDRHPALARLHETARSASTCTASSRCSCPTYWTIAALALFIHVVVNNKYLGHFVVVLYYIVEIMIERDGL